MGMTAQGVSVRKFELCQKMTNQSVKYLALFFAVAMVGALVPLGPVVASMNPTGPAWHARIVVKGEFADLMSAGSGLYAVSLPTKGPASSGTRVVRVDPTSGKVVATSAVLPGITAPQLVDGAIWVAGQGSHGTSSNQSHFVVSELSASTLRRVRDIQAPLGPFGEPILAGGPGGLLWVGVEGGTSSCDLRRVNPATGGSNTLAVVRVSRNPCAGMTLDTTGRYLYAATSAGSSDEIFKLNARTGAIIGHGFFQAPAILFSMVAVASRLWVAGGYPGTEGSLTYLSTSPLKVLAYSNFGEQSAGTLPTFGQFPVVDYSDGRVWVGSDTNLACFVPTSPRVLAQVGQGPPPPIVTDSLVVTGGQLWANAYFGPPTGLVRLTPPRKCLP
jgi:hypothetical protein